jgi:uroporphyrinogen-III synthase
MATLRREVYPQALDGVHAELCLVSSASVLPALAARWPDRSAAPPFAAMAPRSAGRLAEAGFRVALAAEGGAVALAYAIAGCWEGLGRPRSILWPTSDAGVARPEQATAREILSRLKAHDGAPPRLVVVPCVRLLPVEGLREAIAGALGEAETGDVAEAHARPVCLLFHAPSAVRAWLAAWPAAALPPQGVACVGASTLDAVSADAPLGWPAPVAVPLDGLPEALGRLGGEPLPARLRMTER